MSDQLNLRLGTESITWQLEDLYKGLNDQAIEQDILHCRTEAEDIEKSFCGRIAELTAEDILQLVVRLEDLSIAKGRLVSFASLFFSTRILDQDAGAFMQKIREEGSKTAKFTVFFELEFSAIPAEQANQLLNDPKLAHYKHYLANIRRYAPHLLSQQEETLLIEIGPVGRSSWILLFEKVMGHIKFGARQRTEEEVLSDLYSPERTTRQQAAADMTEGLNSQIHILTHITNTMLADKMIDDRLRQYPGWVNSMNLYNELDDETVEVLVHSVTGRYDIVQRYYHFKKELLGLDELLDYDRYAPLPNLPGREITWPDSRKLVLQAFNAFSPEMAKIADLFFEREWIHAPIMAGKRSGAFAHSCIPNVHPYVMVNYTGNMRDVSTVAHELGHGVHQYLAAEQGYYNSDTPLVLAETASVFAELLLFNLQLDMVSHKKERSAFIGQKLESIFATVFRQIAMNRFEELSHNARREQGELSTEKLSGFWIKTQEAMFADSVILSTDYSTWWSYIPHFLASPGYVYSYAFGELLVLALYNLYQTGPDSFVPQYIDLLKAGGSASPYELVEPFGVNLNDPQFWQGGLQVIDRMLQQIERN